MNKEYVFRDKNNDFYVLGDKKCMITGEVIKDFGFIRVSPKGNSFISVNGLKEDKKNKIRVVQYFQFFVTNDVSDDFILVDFKLPSMVNGDNITVFDVDTIDKKYPSETIDKTKLAGRENLDNTYMIGTPDYKRLEELDKSIDDVSDVDALYDDIKSSKIVVDNDKLLEDGR